MMRYWLGDRLSCLTFQMKPEVLVNIDGGPHPKRQTRYDLARYADE